MRIREIREARGMTQQQLAEGMGVVRSAIANWEAGISSPRSDMLTQLADSLHCTIDELFGRGENAEAGEQDSADEKTAQAGGGEGVRDYD